MLVFDLYKLFNSGFDTIGKESRLVLVDRLFELALKYIHMKFERSEVTYWTQLCYYAKELAYIVLESNNDNKFLEFPMCRKTLGILSKINKLQKSENEFCEYTKRKHRRNYDFLSADRVQHKKSKHDCESSDED